MFQTTANHCSKDRTTTTTTTAAILLVRAKKVTLFTPPALVKKIVGIELGHRPLILTPSDHEAPEIRGTHIVVLLNFADRYYGGP